MVDSEILLVLRPFAAFSTVDDLAIEEGWEHVQTFDRTKTQFYEEIWEVDDARAVIRYIDDHFVIANYISVSGDERERLVSLITEKIDIIPEDELWYATRYGKKTKREQAIRFLAAIKDEFDADFAKILDEAADDSDPEVRNSTLLAIGRVAWPELWPIVQRRLTQEKDTEIKSQAEALFEAFREHVDQS